MKRSKTPSVSFRTGKSFLRFLKENSFQWIPQIFSNDFIPGGTVREHLDSLRTQIEECLDHAPLFFNAHSGYDNWSPAEAEDFYGQALALEKEVGIPISHETHRLRYFATPWQTRHILNRFPELLVTCDFSHWVCVCERLLPDMERDHRSGSPPLPPPPRACRIRGRAASSRPRRTGILCPPEGPRRLVEYNLAIPGRPRLDGIHPYPRVRPAALPAHSASYPCSRGRSVGDLRLDGPSPKNQFCINRTLNWQSWPGARCFTPPPSRPSRASSSRSPRPAPLYRSPCSRPPNTACGGRCGIPWSA